MFIKRDMRKVRDILADPKDARTELKLARREPEFDGSTAIVLRPENLEAIKDVRYMSLYHNKLRSFDFSETLTLCTALTDLNLGRNELTSLPDDIGRIPALRRLWVEDNRLTSLPVTLFDRHELELLKACGNTLTSVPAEFGRLTSLKELALEGNHITSIDPHALEGLASLEQLLLRGNRIDRLPSTVACLTSLRVLHINSNGLLELPAELSHCLRLTTLVANSNAISTVPDAIVRLPALRNIDLGHNRIASLSRLMARRWSLGLPAELQAVAKALQAATAAATATAATTTATGAVDDVDDDIDDEDGGAAAPSSDGDVPMEEPVEPLADLRLNLVGNPVLDERSKLFSASQLSQSIIEQVYR